MKIAIADAGDEAFDSGVFIQGNSVSCSTAPAASIVSTPVSCGGANGTAAVSVTNYTATPTYSWSPGGQTTSSLSGLAAGTYTCVVGFLTACSGVFNQTLVTTVSNPTSFSLSTTSTPATCVGSATGSASVAISGGTAPYTVLWNTTQTTNGINNLTPGIYTVTVEDNASCSQITTVNVGVGTPTTLQFSTMQVCGNNSILTSSSGSSYQWYDTSNVIIVGATAQTHSVTNLANGQHYIVSYKDNTTGCTDSLQINISKYNLNFTEGSGPACHGGNSGSISLSPSGTYTFSSYDWSISGASSAAGTSTATPIAIPNLPAGNYTVAVNPTGNPSCLYTYSISVSPLPLQILTPDTQKVCNLDTISLNPPVAAGSTNNWYTSTLSPLGTSLANAPFSVLPNPVQVNNTTFIDTIISSAGCRSALKINIKIKSFQKTVSVIQKLKCYNDSIGKVKIVVPRETNGPLGTPYSFTWYYPAPYTSPAVVPSGSTTPVSSTEANLHAGSYYCIIKSGNCTDTASFSISNLPKPQIDSIYAYYCPKDSLAWLTADTGNVNYQWHPSNVGVTSTGDSIHVPVQNINGYYVTYKHAGCADTAKVIVPVTVYNAFRPNEMVNVFTPNGDKSNDFFYPFYSSTLNQYQIFKQSDTYELKVYDRWGKLMYETTDYSKPWDGKNKGGSDAVDGSYFYVVKYKSNCGSNADIEEKKGFVELVR